MLSSHPVVCADEYYVGVAAGTPMLKGIVEDDNIGSDSGRVAYARISISVHYHRHRWIKTRVHERLISTISAKNNRRRFS